MTSNSNTKTMTSSKTYGIMSMVAMAMSMLTMMVTMPLGTDAAFGIPDNVDFVTHMYNDSNCNTSSYKNITFHNFCYDTKIENGYPQCCNEILSDISLFENASFRQCIKTNMTFTNLTGVSYDCNMTHLKHMGTAGALSYVGLISMLLIGIMIVGYMGWVISGGRKTYAKI
jgi:hypothetical protein